MQYAGAYNPVFIVRNKELIELKADKMPIGIHAVKVDKGFTNKDFQLEKNDMVYLFSDGYVDQFGGEKGKKLKTTNFKSLLLSLRDKSMSEQKKTIDQTFEEWKGDLEQLDDVCVIGVRV